MSAEPKTCNGWTNWETWNWKLWIDNEEGSQNYWAEAARSAWDATDEDETTEERTQAATLELSGQLEAEARENSPLPDSGPYTDIMGAALDEINFEEIAASMIGDLEAES